MGALTSKPFSFTARSWELSDRLAYDFTDTFFSAIKISFRGNSVMRILPEFTQNILSEWISDRARFSYDAATFVNKSSDKVAGLRISLASSTWLRFFSKRFSHLFFSFPIFSFFDLASSKRFFNCFLFAGFSLSSNFNFDFRSSYFTDYIALSNRIIEFKNFFLIGLNIRYQLPILAASLRRVSQADKNFFTFGFFTNNLFSEINLGFRYQEINTFMRAKSRVSRFLFSNVNNSVILTTPQLKNFFVSNFSGCNIFSFFDIPSKLSFAEVFGNNVVLSSVTKNSLCVPHPFTYVTYNIRAKKYQRFDSPYSSVFYGNTTVFFSGNSKLSDLFGDFSTFAPTNSVNYDFTNFYTHFTDSFFYASSLNILLSLKRQVDSRSSFNYYT